MVQLTNLPLSAFAYLRAEVGRQPSDSRTLTLIYINCKACIFFSEVIDVKKLRM